MLTLHTLILFALWGGICVAVWPSIRQWRERRQNARLRALIGLRAPGGAR